MWTHHSDSPKKIVILRSLYLGDFICATPALRALRARFPGAELTLVGLPWTVEILERYQLVDRFVASPGFPGLPEVPFDPWRWKRFRQRMRRERFDLAIQLHGDGHISNGLIEALGARKSIGYRRDISKDRRLSHSLQWMESESEVHRWLRLVALAGAHGGDQVEFPISATDRGRAAVLLGDPPRNGLRIGLHCGSKLPSRRWPIERFAELGNLLGRTVDARLILTGTAAERPLIDRLRSQIAVPAHDLTGRTDLGALAAVIDSLDLLITNDTGVSHVAAARKTPSVILFGPSDPDRWAPLDRVRHRIIDGARDGKRDDTSMMNISVEQVLAACLAQLAQCQSMGAKSFAGVTPLDAVGSRR